MGTHPAKQRCLAEGTHPTVYDPRDVWCKACGFPSGGHDECRPCVCGASIAQARDGRTYHLHDGWCKP